MYERRTKFELIINLRAKRIGSNAACPTTGIFCLPAPLLRFIDSSHRSASEHRSKLSQAFMAGFTRRRE